MRAHAKPPRTSSQRVGQTPGEGRARGGGGQGPTGEPLPKRRADRTGTARTDRSAPRAHEGKGGEALDLARATMKNRFRRTILRHSKAITNITTMLNFFLDAHDDK